MARSSLRVTGALLGALGVACACSARTRGPSGATSLATERLDGTTPSDRKDQGVLLFNGDFETGDLSQWAHVQACTKDRITVYSASNAPPGAPMPRQGKYAAEFRVLDTDTAPCTPTENPRAQVLSPRILEPGVEVWEGWSVFIPRVLPPIRCPDAGADAACDDPWMVIQVDYGRPFGTVPIVSWGLDQRDGKTVLRLARNAQYGGDWPWWEPAPFDRWIDVVVHKRLAATPDAGGFIEAWVDGAPLTLGTGGTRLEMQTMITGARAYAFVLNSYRTAHMFPTATLYFDAARLGTTRAVVDPAMK